MPTPDERARAAIDTGALPHASIDGVLRALNEAGLAIVDANSRAVIGGNNPPLGQMIAAESSDFAQVVTAFLEEEYRQYPDQLNALIEAAEQLPETIDDQETKEAAATVVKQLRDLNAKFQAFHDKEKQPYLRGGQAVDQYFFGMMDKVMRRARANRFGAADVLLQRITDYDNRVIAAEQERRRREAEEAARIAHEAREKAERERREAEERRRAEERARTEATRAQRASEAAEAEQQASTSHVEAEVTHARAEEAHIATFVRPADITRNRGLDGTLTTTAQEKYAVVVDRALLDKDKLWPFIPIKALEQALTSYAKTTDYNVPMAGAEIGRRNRSVVR